MASHLDVDKLTTMMRSMNMEPRDRFDDDFVNNLCVFLKEFDLGKDNKCCYPEDFNEALLDLEKTLQETPNSISTDPLETMSIQAKPSEEVAVNGEYFEASSREKPKENEKTQFGFVSRYKIDRRNKQMRPANCLDDIETVGRRSLGKYKIDRRVDRVNHAVRNQSRNVYDYSGLRRERFGKYGNSCQTSYGHCGYVEMNFRRYCDTTIVYHNVRPSRYFGNVKIDRRRTSVKHEKSAADLADNEYRRRLNVLRSDRKIEINEKRYAMFNRQRDFSN